MPMAKEHLYTKKLNQYSFILSLINDDTLYLRLFKNVRNYHLICSAAVSFKYNIVVVLQTNETSLLSFSLKRTKSIKVSFLKR